MRVVLLTQAGDYHLDPLAQSMHERFLPEPYPDATRVECCGQPVISLAPGRAREGAPVTSIGVIHDRRFITLPHTRDVAVAWYDADAPISTSVLDLAEPNGADPSGAVGVASCCQNQPHT